MSNENPEKSKWRMKMSKSRKSQIECRNVEPNVEMSKKSNENVETSNENVEKSNPMSKCRIIVKKSNTWQIW
jgi:hypothetical protein